MPACSVCFNIYQHKKSLLRHIREKHKAGFQCDHCSKIFSFRSKLISHLELHGFQAPKKLQFLRKYRAIMICSLCEERFNRYEKYYTHLEQEHGIKLDEEKLSFNSRFEFEQWKESQANLHNVFYVKRTSTKFLASGEKVNYFLCHRSYAPNITTGRRTKYIGSTKIGRCCPSRMKVVWHRTNCVSVHYTKTHLGHTCDLPKIPLTSTEKRNIARKLHPEVSFEIILEDIEVSSSTNTSTLQWSHLTDLQNVPMLIDHNASVQNPNNINDNILVVQHNPEDNTNNIADLISQIKAKIQRVNQLSCLLPTTLKHESAAKIDILLNNLIEEMNLQINDKNTVQSLQENTSNAKHNSNNNNQKIVNQQHFYSICMNKTRRETTGLTSPSNNHSQPITKLPQSNKPALSNSFDHTYYL